MGDSLPETRQCCREQPGSSQEGGVSDLLRLGHLRSMEEGRGGGA